jgi:phenylacetate-CoA ligase
MLYRVLSDYFSIQHLKSLPSAELQDIQIKRLRHIVKHAWLNVPYYSKKMKELGMTPDDIVTLEDLARLPTTSKSELASEKHDEMIAQNMQPKGCTSRNTTGTTGKPTTVLWSGEYADYITALRFVNTKRLGIRLTEKVISVEFHGVRDNAIDEEASSRSIDLRKIRKFLYGPWVAPALITLRWKRVGFRKSVSEISDVIVNYKPAGIYSRPSYLRELGAALESKAQKLNIRKALLSGEVISETCRRDIQNYFGCETFESYGAEELGSIAIECSTHQGLHVQPHLIVEVIKDGQNVGSGERGEVVITNLGNSLMPLIRYRLGDIVEMMPKESCRCGSESHRILKVYGRKQDILVRGDGCKVYSRDLLDMLEATLGFRDFQIEQKESGDLAVRLPADRATNVAKISIANVLKGVLGSEANISWETWNAESRPVKYRPIFSRIAA